MKNKTIYFINQKNDNPKILELYLYDDIKGDSEDWWSGQKIESNTSSNHVKQVLDEAGDIDQINVYINSNGGSVKEGLGIYNQLKRKPCQKTAYIDGFACSIASVIAMACDKVVMGTNALMMIHHASMCAYGNSEELRKAATDLDVIDKASCSSYLEKAGDKLTEEELNQLLDGQTWLNAEQCIQYGLADEIAGKEDKNIEEAQQRLKNSIRQQLEDIQPSLDIPDKFKQQKTFADKLRMKFKNRMEEGK